MYLFFATENHVSFKGEDLNNHVSNLLVWKERETSWRTNKGKSWRLLCLLKASRVGSRYGSEINDKPDPNPKKSFKIHNTASYPLAWERVAFPFLSCSLSSPSITMVCSDDKNNRFGYTKKQWVGSGSTWTRIGFVSWISSS